MRGTGGQVRVYLVRKQIWLYVATTASDCRIVLLFEVTQESANEGLLLAYEKCLNSQVPPTKEQSIFSFFYSVLNAEHAILATPHIFYSAAS